MSENSIIIKGARVNNLKNIDLEIPRDKLVVITGLSGSGKSSLAFDTLYAEGQRRYVESLSAYARQFLGRMQKPECDYIKGLPPAIAIEQKVTTRNPRSTVGTSTEIYEYLRLLFARVGHTYSPISGEEVKKQTPEDVIRLLHTYSEGTRFMILCRPKSSVETLKQQGFVRFEEDAEGTLLVVDRLTVSHEKDALTRMTDSIETAFYEGGGEMMVKIMPAGIIHTFSTRFEADGMTFIEPNDNLFSFNSPMGACPECEGFGKIIGIDESLVIPDSSRSLYDGAVMCWRGEKLGEWKDWFIKLNSERGFPIHKPYYQLTQREKDWLWHGKPTENVDWELTQEEREWGLASIDAFFESLRQAQYKIQNRVMLARYRGKTTCPCCRGMRLRKEATYVKVGGKAITELVDLSVEDLLKWFHNLQLPENEAKIAERLLTEITSRLQFLVDVGLPYLTLSRPSNSLSGGESQRINLATSLGSALVGSLYILDEPSIGLHSRDTERLIKVLKQLRDLGNTVIVVEHDEEIIRTADYIIDIGPNAGRLGGEVVFAGSAEPLPKQEGEVVSHTLKYLSREETIDVPTSRRRWNKYIEIVGARANNLKGINAKIPLNVMTCVTGVSGSGKSSLVRDIFYNAMQRQLGNAGDRPGEFQELKGNVKDVQAIEFVDQNPIGKSSRSNPVTYVKAWDEIRRLMAAQPLSKQMGYTATHFSFNADGGRCEECKGDGTITIEMQFMADLVLPCESCKGMRFKQDILDVRFEGKNVADMLDMTINQAVEFFSEHKQDKIVRLLKPLQDVGLGYIKMGQSSSTLSGGENQRVKLSYYLGMEKCVPTLFIFDEPTTGLHFHDIRKLLSSFNALLQRGHTIVIIEHNMDIIKCADYVIDLGPEGGREGGAIVGQGTPEEITRIAESYTGHYLKAKLALLDQ